MPVPWEKRDKARHRTVAKYHLSPCSYSRDPIHHPHRFRERNEKKRQVPESDLNWKRSHVAFTYRKVDQLKCSEPDGNQKSD